MNKLFIVLLAVCLVSVHAFVKRETATEQPDIVKTIQKGFEEFSKSASEIFDADKIKKGFNDVVDNFNAAVQKFSQKSDDAKQ